MAVGEYSLQNETEAEAPHFIRIASRKSPGFNEDIFKGDIELLTLETEVNFTGKVSSKINSRLITKSEKL